MKKKQTQWLTWLNEIQSIAQVGLTYCENHFGLERYQRLKEIAAEIAAAHTDQDYQSILNLFSEEKAYMTPKIDLRGAVFQDDKILLVKERADQCWSLPGGWADVNESPSEGVEREIYEETGYRTKAVKLLAFYDKLKHNHPPEWPHAYKCFFLCELQGGEPQQAYEILDMNFFEENDLPELSRNRVIEEQIHRLFEHHRYPDWSTDFD